MTLSTWAQSTVARENTYVLTADDLYDGRNKLGIDVSHLPLDVPLCEGCDNPVPSHGYCSSCDVVHADIAGAQLTVCNPDPLKDAA